MVSQDLQRLDILRITADQTLHEGDFDVQLAHLFARQPFAFGTALLRHTTASIISLSAQQVKCHGSMEARFGAAALWSGRSGPNPKSEFRKSKEIVPPVTRRV
jgi:hypothetical protein